MSPNAPHPLGKAVRDILERQKLSVREVARRSKGGISTTSILNILGGHVPYAEVIIAFVDAVYDNPEEREVIANQLLQLADKPMLRYVRQDREVG